ncbi:MFS transporter [Govanella unica]|uniref:MFS transporter n=1 Tax=Govanella unica TaxID=2975056 RepID=A0A9X3TYQ3_9PROT|nr:MFS transporter [Govania unica]MDA5194142.1 MFS transporter [Govania unica]
MATPAQTRARGAGNDFSPLQMFALIFVVCTGFSSQMVMPLWIGAIIDNLGLTQKEAGSIASIEFMAVALVSVVVAVQVHRFNAKLTASVGLVLLLLGNLMAAYADSASMLTMCRVLTGVGKGLVVAITFSLVAGTSHPTRGFALLNVSYAVFSTVFYLVVPTFIKMNGAAGAFLMMAAVAGLGMVFLYWFPNRTLAATELKGGRLRDIPAYGYVALGALVILWTGHNAVWTFIERLGTRVDLSLQEIGAVLSLAAFLTIGGPSLARLIDTRFGYTKPIITATSIKILVVMAMVYVPLGWLYMGTVPLFLIMALFIVPYVMGILSLADPAGRLAAASSAAMTAGGSLGALLGGYTADSFGYSGLAWAAVVNFVVVIALVAMIAPRLRSQGVAETPAVS